MSQQLNLLTRERRAFNPLLIALVVWGLVLFGLAMLWTVDQVRLLNARDDEAAAAKQLRDARGVIQQREDARQALVSEIAATQPLANAARDLMTLAGNLGSTQGYADEFGILASVTEPDLWLTNVEIRDGGKAIKISGRALNNAAALNYGRNLNAAFAARGARFTTLEMAPVTIGKRDGGGPALTSTKFMIQ